MKCNSILPGNRTMLTLWNSKNIIEFQYHNLYKYNRILLHLLLDFQYEKSGNTTEFQEQQNSSNINGFY